ncbi:MAG: hypothetical protein RMY28_013345 [Nostoc sp. ChiSLP01]
MSLRLNGIFSAIAAQPAFSIDTICRNHDSNSYSNKNAADV